MKKLTSLLITIISICILPGCTTNNKTSDIKNTTSESSQSVTTSTINIFALGDSLTAGYQLPIEDSWPSQLESILQTNGYNNYKIINGGKSGDTSQQLKDRLARSTADAKSGDIAIITIGGNDGFQGIPIQVLEKNLYEIILQLQQKGVITIIGGMQITTNLGETYTKNFAAIYPRIAEKTNSRLIPFLLEGVATDPSLNLPDMIHPNKEGYNIVATTVYQHLSKNNLLQKTE